MSKNGCEFDDICDGGLKIEAIDEKIEVTVTSITFKNGQQVN
jgi:hypothetical protein